MLLLLLLLLNHINIHVRTNTMEHASTKMLCQNVRGKNTQNISRLKGNFARNKLTSDGVW